jgi:lipoprotein-releasing system ATP-binding protein
MTKAQGDTLLEALDLVKSFVGGDGSELVVLDHLDFKLLNHEAVAIVGSSGAGKSTLLQILGGLDLPTSGKVLIDGKTWGEGKDQNLEQLRNQKIGFVFQFHHLLKDFTALENVMMPSLIAGNSKNVATKRARELLRQVKLEHRLHHKPAELSGGEQQRVAVARALCNEPKVLLADEPSGNLDSQSSEALHQLLFRLKEVNGLAMIIVTHSKKLAEMTDRVLELRDGKLLEDGIEINGIE